MRNNPPTCHVQKTMTRLQRLPLAAAALTAAALLATAASATAVTTGAVRVPHTSTVSVDGAPGAVGVITTSLLVPNSWKRQKSKGTPTWLAGHGNCFYRVTTRSTLTVAPSSLAAVRVAGDLPEVGPRILDSGTRNSAAWRVTRPEMAGRKHLRAVASFATRATSGVALLAGQSLWLEVWLDGLSRVGDECHSGTYRQTLGPQMGDVLSTVHVRSYIKP